MKFGEANSGPLTPRQRKAFRIVFAATMVIVLISAVTHFTYRDWPAFVVGDELEISAGAAGTIARIERRENETYQRGDVLVVVESEALRVRLDAVDHDLEEIARSLAAEQSEVGVERRRFELETSIAETASQLRSSRADLQAVGEVLPSLRELKALAEERARSGEALRREDALTAAELEERRRSLYEVANELAEAVARREGLEAKVAEFERVLGLYQSRLRGLVDERTAFITDLELRRQEKEGERENLLAALAGLRVVADHDGMVTAVLRKEGEYVSSGGPLLRVMRNEELWVEAYLPVADKLKIRPGDRVEVIARAPAGKLAGRVQKILPVLKPLPENMQAPLSRADNYAIVVITMENPAAASSVLSPAEQVTARIRRRLVMLRNEPPNAQARP